MEQHHFSQGETASVEASASFSRQPDYQEEETETNALAESTVSIEAIPLAALLQQEARIRQQGEVKTFAWAGAFLAAMLTTANTAISDPSHLEASLAVCFTLMGAVGTGLYVQLVRSARWRKRSFTETLTQVRDVEQAGPLIQVLRVQEVSVGKLTKQILTTLLPALQASDAALLSDSDRAILRRQLSIAPNDLGYRDLRELFSRSAFRREVDFRVAILKALEQVGGSKELEVVERLSRGTTIFRVPAEIQQAAQECLPYLQGRASEQRAREQLLRASSVHSLPDDTLLRPASAQADTSPEQLLRASKPHPDS